MGYGMAAIYRYKGRRAANVISRGTALASDLAKIPAPLLHTTFTSTNLTAVADSHHDHCNQYHFDFSSNERID